MGIIEEISNSRKFEQTRLPYHALVRYDKNTTNVGVVLKTKGPSLNECLEKGPQPIPIIFDILIRFRSFPMALAADAEKLEPDQNFLQFLSFDDAFLDEKIIRNLFVIVVFGLTS